MDAQLRPTRRQLLGGIGGAALVAVLQPFGSTAVLAKGGGSPTATRSGPATLAEFMDLSEALTDEEFSLQDDVGAQYFAALDPAALQALVQATVRRNNPPRTFAQILASGALRDDRNAATAQQILVYWYSGLVNGVTADFMEALAWEAFKDVGGIEISPPTDHIGFGDWSELP